MISFNQPISFLSILKRSVLLFLQIILQILKDKYFEHGYYSNDFINIVECGCNVSIAAKWHISQSALSQFVTNFEATIRTALLIEKWKIRKSDRSWWKSYANLLPIFPNRQGNAKIHLEVKQKGF